MKNGWRVVLMIVMVALLLGLVAVGVGYMTGADMSRILSVLDGRYQLDLWQQYIQSWQQYALNLWDQVLALLPW